MNPSITGWIKKYYSEKDSYLIFTETASKALIRKIREIGFSYGIIDLNTLPPIYKQFDYTQEELSKICFLQILEAIYLQHAVEPTTDSFLQKINEYYDLVNPPKNTLIKRLFKDKDLYAKLENTLTARWQEHFFSQSKNNDFVLNMLLFFVDALAFETYLIQHIEPNTFDTTLVDELIGIITSFKQDKEEKQSEDLSLILYLKKMTHPDSTILKHGHATRLETCFVLDFLICNAWNNDTKELMLLDLDTKPLKRIKYTPELVEESKASFMAFVLKQNNNYAFFRSTNLFQNIMGNSTKYIELILTRNKTRLVKELQKNTQLMKLLADSAVRELNPQEKKIVKNQTIEILKTIPSLAIFILPGGSLLLPIILKFIPSLLPSSFNENSESAN